MASRIDPRRRCLVIGAGPAGLAVASQLGDAATVLEGADRVGGLCQSIHHGGGVFDLGGHSFHTPDPEVEAFVADALEGGLHFQRRQATVWAGGQLIPYPFQQFFDRIRKTEIVRECAQGLEAAARDATPPANFEQFLVQRYGAGIARHFLLPYNRKLWARDLSTIACDWVHERVAGSGPPGGIAAGDGKSRAKARQPLHSESHVGYPASGGYEEICRALARKCRSIQLRQRVVTVDPEARLALTSDGERHPFEALVSTAPLPELLRMVRGAPRELIESADDLPYVSLRIELLLVGRRLDTDIQRIYCADPLVPPHKIALNHNSSPELRDRPVHAITAEVSLGRADEPARFSGAGRTAEFLAETGVLNSREEVIWTGHRDLRYGYPVYTHSRAGVIAAAKEWLQARGIHTLGRFGEWAYINADACIAKGLALGRHLGGRYAALA